MRFHLPLVLALTVAAGSCARRSAIAQLNAPDPTGCFVEVFDGEEFKGGRDFINGPAKYWHLREMPLRVNWHRRIRSLRVGPTATVTAWVEEGFEGEFMRSGPDRSHRTMIETFSGKIASLQVACAQPPAEPVR